MDNSLLKLGTLIAVFAFYIPFFIVMSKGLGAKSGRRHFYRSVKKILEREEQNIKAIDQLSIVYRKVAENNAEFSKKYRTPIDICEDLLSRSTGFNGWVFKFHYGIQFSDEQVSRIAEIIKTIENDLPFISLSPKYGNQLDMLKLAYDSNDIGLGLNGLKQLAKDIKFLETTIDTQERKNRVSTWISVIGIILTIIFGAVSLVQVYSGGNFF
ncbi:hypothetical protein HT094_19095 [Shewanella sp. ZOR0012]|uniref:hypothetical protein n=1 Tax=Shewanella TaxID=22 RepID=UPI000645CF3B|nr:MULTISPECIES: hypothetical protein [Shewanella]MCH7422724.1 hypothetical protein [Shewanella sp. MM_2022_3]NSM26264.1 hypothetical protein [Shewanella sp. ZOR0012]